MIQEVLRIPDKEAFSVASRSLGVGTRNEPMCLAGSPRIFGILTLEICLEMTC